MTTSLTGKTILLIVSGGIAAYKALELVRLLKKSGAKTRAILTSGGAQFITPLSLAALTEHDVYTDLWSLKDETEMGHIRLSREADLIVIAPASANILAQMAHGLANDLASTTLLAADKPILAAPAMNHKMWDNPATQANIKTLRERGISFVGPTEGDMACGEFGMGRMSEPEEILEAIRNQFSGQKNPSSAKPLKGRRALVTSGPTFEPLDPVRFIGNYSSGKQGHAIAKALALAGADVTLVTGPVSLLDPPGIKTIRVNTAREMLAACERSLPADIAVCAAAVADWRATDTQEHKIKKTKGAKGALQVAFTENPDILHTLSTHKKRPALVIGFAAETDKLLENAEAKLKRKQCDWLLANEVGGEKAFGRDENHVYLIGAGKTENWKTLAKTEIARKLTDKITEHFKSHDKRRSQIHAAE